MSNGRLLRQIIKHGAKYGDPEFIKAAEEIIREERQKKHHLLANDLERILYGKIQPSPKQHMHEIPIDRERGLPLFEIREPSRDLQDVILSDENRSIIDEILLEQSRAEVLFSYGLRPSSRLLFFGPPGCGKTLTAEVLASELSLELVIVRFDAVISSFLGETAANLRKVFDFLEKGTFVALFDEFDAIGKEREDSAEHGELKRVVNSVLQMIDGYRGKSLIIASTNHEKLLDRALWRRFDEVLVFERPNFEQIRKLLEIKLRGVRYELPLDDRSFIHQFKGFSHADIERIVIKSIKAMVLKGREFLTVDMLEEARRREEMRLNMILKL